ncbi:hypothetical protein MTO96_021784 [Rhipicephalus appendiculatus]
MIDVPLPRRQFKLRLGQNSHLLVRSAPLSARQGHGPSSALAICHKYTTGAALGIDSPTDSSLEVIVLLLSPPSAPLPCEASRVIGKGPESSGVLSGTNEPSTQD